MAQSTSKSPGGIDIGVVQQVAVVVHDLQRFAVPDADFAGMELPSLLRNRIRRQCQSDQRSGRDHDGCGRKYGQRTTNTPHRVAKGHQYLLCVPGGRRKSRQATISALQTKAGQVRFMKVEGLS